MPDRGEALVPHPASLRLIEALRLPLLRLPRRRLPRGLIIGPCAARLGLLLNVQSADLVSGPRVRLLGGSEPLLGRFVLLLVAEVVDDDVLVDDLRLGLRVERGLRDPRVAPVRHLSLVGGRLLESLGCRLRAVPWVHRAEALLASALVATRRRLLLKDSSPLPNSLQLRSHVADLVDSLAHLPHLEVRSRLRTEVLRLRPVVCLPPLTEWMRHSVVGEVVIFKVEVVKVVAARLDFLAEHDHPDQLVVCLLVSDPDVHCLLSLSKLSASHLLAAFNMKNANLVLHSCWIRHLL